MAKWLQALQKGFETGREHYGGRPSRQPQSGWERPEVTENRDWPQGNVDRQEFEAPPMDAPMYPDTQRVAEQAHEIEALRATIAELNVEIARGDAQRTADAERMGALTEAVAQLRGQIDDVQAAYKPFIEVLKLPGLRKWLLEKFHPDRWPDANATQRQLIDEAAKNINAAYDIVNQQQAAEGE